MNKLETITQLLVNELTDFEANVKRLENGLQRAEDLRVKFDLGPIDNLVSELKSFQQKETKNREAYVTRLDRKLENAKIYPKWAVITFISALIISFGGILYSYAQNQSIAVKEKKAYNQGIKAYQAHLDTFFEEYPKTFEVYKDWNKKQ
ncbi:DUF6730 family protein [Flagellimonas sp. SN16]|uniref:DUF6730 family protein n=1 Tax=Flagellimonas sp. SN16 TaxID=3415142 RepID=UPI000C968BBC|nr:hypothetical protein [Pseudozobellia sp.]|tara:strand:- start:1805 stop:2251 length:447 start_codon:yes stop_codon:yes gene_type:complete